MSNNPDNTVLASVFASRVALAKMPVHEAVQQAEQEWHKTQIWVASKSEREGSFNWFCDMFDMDASAVRRAIKERK